MFKYAILALVAACAFFANPVAAAPATGVCALEIETGTSQWRIDDIDLFSQQTRGSTFDLQLINTGTGKCSLHLSFDKSGSPFGLLGPVSTRVPYQLIDHDTGKDLTPKNGSAGVNYPGVIKIEPQSTRTIRLDFIVPPQFESDGVYVQSLQIAAENDGPGSVGVRRMQTLVASVASSAVMSLSGSFTRNGGVADVDLGTISQPGLVPVPLFLKVRSSRAYRIRSSSQNSGKLVLTGTSWSIPYTLTINGNNVNPAGGQYTSVPGPNRRNDTLPLGFIITGSADVAAGRYADLVTLEISLN